MKNDLIVLPMDGPFGSSGVYSNGINYINYVDYRLPDSVTNAIGIGCAGRTLSVPEGSPCPIVKCERHTSDGRDFLIGVWMGVETVRDRDVRLAQERSDLLDRIEEFLDNYVDVNDGDDGRPVPNRAMSLLSDVQDARARRVI